MPNFGDKLKGKRDSHAYVMGCKAYHAGYPPSHSPYSASSEHGREWLDGYFDAWFLVTGVNYGN
jgi:hypothetical protein